MITQMCHRKVGTTLHSPPTPANSPAKLSLVYIHTTNLCVVTTQIFEDGVDPLATFPIRTPRTRGAVGEGSGIKKAVGS
jgi:hypothetical protein